MKGEGAVGVTGTPGTGKKTTSPILASLLGRKLIEIGSLAAAHAKPDEHGEIPVDVSALRPEVRRAAAGAVVSGHLLADVLSPSKAEFVAVLRCEPSVLKRRLEKRAYPSEKVIENVEAELIGVVLDSAVMRYGPAKVHEYDSTHATAASIARTIAGDFKSGKYQTTAWIDWTLDYDSSTKLRSLLSNPRTESAST